MAKRAPKPVTKFPFTKQRIDELKPPASDRRFYYDSKVSGLALVVTAAGTKTFYSYRWGWGSYVKVKLGVYSAADGAAGMTIEQARVAASKVNDQVHQGIDPHAIRQQRQNEPTFGELFTHWLENWAKQRLQEATWKENERQYKTLLSGWSSRRLSTIHEGDVQALHARIGRDHGKFAANRAIALVKMLFGKKAGAARAVGFRGSNPTEGVTKFPEVKRDRFLQADELPRFFEALAQEPNATLRDFYLACLLSGARRSNVQAMRWDDVDVNGAVWRIPRTKSGDPLTIPLSPPLVKLLVDRKAVANGDEWVFPGRRGGHLTDPKFGWKRLTTRANLPGLRMHDLRRSLASWGVMTGASLPVVGKLLGHSQPQTTQIYARLQLDPVRQAVNTATAAMLTAGGLLKVQDAPKRKARTPQKAR